MKSVGEVMAIGRTFEEALQKAIRMLEIGHDGLIATRSLDFKEPEEILAQPEPERIFAIPRALRKGLSIEQIHKLTHIDPWFLHCISRLVELERNLAAYRGGTCPKRLLLEAKRGGCSDRQISRILDMDEQIVSRHRRNMGIFPVVKQIDTLAAEYPAQTNYLYLTYNGTEDDLLPEGEKSVLVLGSGSYRIGSSVEFDWCCVNASRTLRKLGYRSILLNCNPETVSTDYDVCDRLYFEEISVESVLDLYQREKCIGVIVSVGGQTPNNLAPQLHEAGVRILGTSPVDIDCAEDRYKFSTLLDTVGVDQPPWREVSSLQDAVAFAEKTGYPVLLRPSYVLSGAAMGVATNSRECELFLRKAADVSPKHPVVVSKFFEDTKEIEVDAVASQGKIVAMAVLEHVENAGVHSGDATLVTRPQRTYLEVIRKVEKISARIALSLNITGPFNVQYLAQGTNVKVIEANLRASRSFPFVSKIYKVNFIELAIQAILGLPAGSTDKPQHALDYVASRHPTSLSPASKGLIPLWGSKWPPPAKSVVSGTISKKPFSRRSSRWDSNSRLKPSFSPPVHSRTR
jgi:carbamoyl-phosphate synthase large subunit